MKRFTFRLEAVLKYREIIQTLREREFAEAQGHLARAENDLAELRERFQSVVASRPGGETGKRFDTETIIERERYLETLLVAIDSHQKVVEAVRLVADAKRAELVAARQAREAVARLREKDLFAHQALVLKLEQDVLDEMATLRHARGNLAARAAVSHQEAEAV